MDSPSLLRPMQPILVRSPNELAAAERMTRLPAKVPGPNATRTGTDALSPSALPTRRGAWGRRIYSGF